MFLSKLHAPKRKINLGQKKGRNAEREWRGDSCFNSVIQVSGGFQSPRARKSWSGRGSASREGERNWRGSWSLAICQDRRRERFHVCEKRSRSCGVLLVSFHPPPAVTLPYSYAFESQIAATSVVRNLRAFSVWR